jgi:hypothetical protein
VAQDKNGGMQLRRLLNPNDCVVESKRYGCGDGGGALISNPGGKRGLGTLADHMTAA